MVVFTQANLATVDRNIIKGNVATSKWLYSILSASWGWTLGILAATFFIRSVKTGYVIKNKCNLYLKF